MAASWDDHPGLCDDKQVETALVYHIMDERRLVHRRVSVKRAKLQHAGRRWSRVALHAGHQQQQRDEDVAPRATSFRCVDGEMTTVSCDQSCVTNFCRSTEDVDTAINSVT